jgi:LmbE family N-acetylglucosaminyl deacetylase
MQRVGLAFPPFFAASLALLGCMLATAPVRADLLIVAPHPDDDIITSAGVILRARQAGETVWVLFMTNGDVLGVETGLTRQDEAVDALHLLNVPESNVIFLGYPDGSLDDLRGPYAGSDTARPAGENRDRQTTTFGERGRGAAEYHRYVFGEAADNNGANVLMDLSHFLSTYDPAHIFVTSEHDRHPDHRSSYYFILDALTSVMAAAPAYNPTVHKTIVWNDFSNQSAWPAAAAPTLYFTEPPDLLARTGLVWMQRESLDVPLEIQTSVLTESLKWRAIDSHNTQGGNTGYIGQFVHKDEFFWTARAQGSNRPPVPNAGVDRTAGRGASVSLNGSASFDPDGTTLSFQWRQTAGPSVTLSSASTAQPSFTVPAGTAVGSVFVFELKVGDGAVTSVADAVSVRVDGTVVQPPIDAGTGTPDAGVDAGTSTPDAGRDAGASTPDAGRDAGTTPDAGRDAGSSAPDAGADAAVRDAGSSPPDAGAGDAATSTPDASTGSPMDAGNAAVTDGATDPAADDAGLIPDEHDADAPQNQDDAGPDEPELDAGTELLDDAGMKGVGRDTGADAPTPSGKRSGCSAGSYPAAETDPSVWPFALLLGTIALRRRR